MMGYSGAVITLKDIGPYDFRSPYYYVKMVLHDQSEDISKERKRDIMRSSEKMIKVLFVCHGNICAKGHGC